MENHATPSRIVLACLLVFWGGQALSGLRQIGPPCDTSKATQTISFVHVGDLHARIGGSFAHKWARLQRYYQDVASANPYTVFTNAGDDYEKGSLAELLSQGAAPREAVFAMGFDVRVLGNHDYAWGEKELLAFSHDPKAIVLASNTVYTGKDPVGFGAVDYGELQVGCVKVGFLGMVSKPWDEFDKQYVGDFLPNFVSRWDWNARAREIIAAHRKSVDLLVMVSHLGFGTDKSVVKYTPRSDNKSISAIDLVLGGHSHGGFQYALTYNTPVVQPEFYGDGLSRFEITWDIKNRVILSRSSAPINVYASSLSATNMALQEKLQNIVDQYAPDAGHSLATLESGRNYVELAAIAAKAGMSVFKADAALIDPALTWVSGFAAGTVTQQMFGNLYRVERQKPGTPGFNGLYTATVSGSDLTNMKQAQPGWVYVGPASPAANATYKVLLHKAPALHPANYFPSNPLLASVAFQSETWWALDQYARARTTGCLHLDTDTTLPACAPDTQTTIWNFDDATQPFKADRGVATMAYRDSANSGWGPMRTAFMATGGPALPNLPDGPSGVMAFPKTAPSEGYAITHNFPANGAFKANGLVSNYTLVMDVLWPSGSDGVWRALMQTGSTNSDDADWFVKNVAGGGIGISQYFGSLQPGAWYRIGMVTNAQASGGSLQFYVNGSNVGSVAAAGQRFALVSQLLALTDNNSETAAGYINALLFSNRSWTATEMAALGGPSAVMALPAKTALQGRVKALGSGDVVVEQPATSRKYKGAEQRKGEFDNKADKLRRE